MRNDDRTKLLQAIGRISQRIQVATDSRSLLAELIGVANEYITKEDAEFRAKTPPPPPRVEQGGVNRMEPESTPTVTRKKKTSE